LKKPLPGQIKKSRNGKIIKSTFKLVGLKLEEKPAMKITNQAKTVEIYGRNLKKRKFSI